MCEEFEIPEKKADFYHGSIQDFSCLIQIIERKIDHPNRVQLKVNNKNISLEEFCFPDTDKKYPRSLLLFLHLLRCKNIYLNFLQCTDNPTFKQVLFDIQSILPYQGVDSYAFSRDKKLASINNFLVYSISRTHHSKLGVPFPFWEMEPGIYERIKVSDVKETVHRLFQYSNRRLFKHILRANEVFNVLCEKACQNLESSADLLRRAFELLCSEVSDLDNISNHGSYQVVFLVPFLQNSKQAFEIG
jgi:hypothetical protein